LSDWLVEEGIGEHRAARIAGGRIAEAKIEWPGKLSPGQVEDAVLVSRAAGSARGTARFESGEEALVDRLPRAASEGARLRLVVTRAAIAERGRLKRAQARPTEKAPRPAPSLAEALGAQVVRHFPACDWDELWAEAWSGETTYPGGTLLFADTPAMTLIDVDGPALPAVPAIADALRRFGVGGTVGIDFPSPADKARRRAIDDALQAALSDWPHERTAINGFGFVHLVARLERPSLLQRIGRARVSAALRHLLRRAETVSEPGALRLAMHPALEARMRPEWGEELARRTGRAVRLASDPALAIEGGFAQAVGP
jgi:hypothetical protein